MPNTAGCSVLNLVDTSELSKHPDSLDVVMEAFDL